jgi:uncharacterized protein with LGFP repeats
MSGLQPRPARTTPGASRASSMGRKLKAITATGAAGALLSVDVMLGASAASAATLEEFARLRVCESGNNYSINTGNGYYGAYQFNLATWRGLGYGGYPHQAAPATQDQAAHRLQAQRGWQPWPACSRKLGLTSSRGLVNPQPVNAINAHWERLGGARGFLGNATTGEFAIVGGRARMFQKGHIIWSAGTGARAVYGDILAKYRSLGGSTSVLGLPTSDEYAIVGGRASNFQGGAIVWSPGTGAHVVLGDIRADWRSQGGTTSALGFPLGDEQAAPAGGRQQEFQRGTYYWSPGTGAHPVVGTIRQKYRAIGGPERVGYPVTREVAVPHGRASHFQHGGVYWNPRNGQASEVRGSIYHTYRANGASGSALGLPTSDEYSVPAGRASDFQGGRITWEAQRRTTSIAVG